MGSYKEGEALTSSARWRSNGKNGAGTHTDEGFRYAITGNRYGDDVFSMEKKSYCYAILGKCMQNDIHFAWEEKAFPMLLLEKHGSSQHNIQECLKFQNVQ